MRRDMLLFRGIAAAVFAGLLMLATSGQAALTDNLEGYWTFDSDGSDSSGNSRDFTMFGSPSFVSGLIGNAVDMDGTDDYGQRNADDEAFDLGSADFTIQAWVNIAATECCTQINMKILEKTSNDGAPSEAGFDFYAHRTAGPGFSYRSNEVNTNLNLNISGEVRAGGGGDETPDVWHQIVLRRNGSDQQMIRDTVSLEIRNIGTTAYSNSTAGLVVGSFFNEGTGVAGSLMNGKLDEVAIWSRALADSEIAQLYNGGAGNAVSGIIAPPTEVAWSNDVAGDWNTSGNWSPSIVPDAADMTAIFGDAIQEPRTVFTDKHVTVKGIQFLNSNSYGVSGLGSINLNSGTHAPKAAIDVFVGDHEFQARVNVQVDTDVTIAGNSSLAFNNTLNLGGNTLTKLGDGTLAIRNTLTTAGGTVSVQAGTVSGNGQVGGDLVNDGGTISPGDSASSMEILGEVVPEPSAAALAVLALVFLAATGSVRP